MASYLPDTHYISSFLFIPNPAQSILEVSDRVLTRLHPRSNVPVLHQTCPDHPPDTCDVPHAERDAVAFEVDRAEGGAGQVGADEDALDLDGAAFELGGLEGDDDCGAVLCGWGGVLAVVYLPSRKRSKRMLCFRVYRE